MVGNTDTEINSGNERETVIVDIQENGRTTNQVNVPHDQQNGHSEEHIPNLENEVVLVINDQVNDPHDQQNGPPEEHIPNLENGVVLVINDRHDQVNDLHDQQNGHPEEHIPNLENGVVLVINDPHDQMVNQMEENNNDHENNGNTKTYILTEVFVLVGGSIYTSIFNMKDSQFENKSFLVGDFLLHSPTQFYLMMFMSVAFALSMVKVVVLTWSMISKLSFYFRGLLALVLSSFFLSYAFQVEKKVPMFWVTINESFKISSFWMVWLYGISLLIVTVVMSYLVKLYVVWRATPNQQR